MLTEFLSEENIAMHKEYVRQKHLKYSIIESYLPCIKGARVSDVVRLGLKREDRRDVLRLLPEIVLHGVYFSSFSDRRCVRCDAVARSYGSEAAYLNLLFETVKSIETGFLAIYRDGTALAFTDPKEAFVRGEPVLAIDLAEHAYFLDYGFDRDRYLGNCLTYLDLTKLTSQNSEV